MNDITKDAKAVLLVFYKEYLSRRETGCSRQDSMYLGDSDKLCNSIFTHIAEDDLSDFCWELSGKGYISCTPGDNRANNITLLPETIVTMEQRFPQGVKQLLEVISKILPLV